MILAAFRLREEKKSTAKDLAEIVECIKKNKRFVVKE